MKSKIAILAILSTIFSLNIHAYDSRKCSEFLIGNKRDSWGKRFWKGVTLMTSTGVSSTQFISSWGDCSMIASLPENQNKIFFAQNLDHLKDDPAKGSGEYLIAFTNLSACDKMSSQKLTKAIRSNYSQVFGDDLEKSPREAYEGISQLVKSNPKISCKYLGS